jgi:hypothetical protein
MVNGYSVHLDVRRELANDGGGDARITPMFTDLMMWAVLAGQPTPYVLYPTPYVLYRPRRPAHT